MKNYILLFIIILLLYFFLYQYNNSEKEQEATTHNINNISPIKSDLDSNFKTAIKKEDKNISGTKVDSTSNTSKVNSPLAKAPPPPSITNKNSKIHTDPIANMPSSYPIKDAAKYFLPPEERRPGHIGGPPPLNFPK